MSKRLSCCPVSRDVLLSSLSGVSHLSQPSHLSRLSQWDTHCPKQPQPLFFASQTGFQLSRNVSQLSYLVSRAETDARKKRECLVIVR
jgi:hypothetical protein